MVMATNSCKNPVQKYIAEPSMNTWEPVLPSWDKHGRLRLLACLNFTGKVRLICRRRCKERQIQKVYWMPCTQQKPLPKSAMQKWSAKSVRSIPSLALLIYLYHLSSFPHVNRFCSSASMWDVLLGGCLMSILKFTRLLCWRSHDLTW